jgi:hypothetical protein
MNVGEGDAAEKVVRMMLTGGEVAVKLTGSMLKNGAALLLALYRNHKKVYGKTSFIKLLKQTRDIRTFTMTPEQFRQFRKESVRYRILYSAVQDARHRNAPVDVILPATEIERANRLFEKIRFIPREQEQSEQRNDPVKKKESRSEPGSHDTRDNSSTRDSAQRKTSEKPSSRKKLNGFKAGQKKKTASARTKTKPKRKVR